MEFVCMFFPAIISLCLYLRNINKDSNMMNSIIYYGVYNLIINFTTLFVVHFIFHQDELTFTSLFTIKYISLSVFLSVITPYGFELVKKQYYKYYPVVEKIYKSGYLKNGKYSIKLLYKNNNVLFDRVIYVLSGLILFFILEIVVRSLAVEKSLFGTDIFKTPFILTFIYYFVFSFFSYFLPKKLYKIYTIFSYVFYIGTFIANYMLLRIKEEALSVGELNNASEGMKFLNFINKEITLKFVIVVLVAVLLSVVNYLFLNKVRNKKKVKLRWRFVVVPVVAVVLLHAYAVGCLDRNDDEFLRIYYPRYYYDKFVNPKKSLSVLGMYEYTYRDIYLAFKDKFSKYGSVSLIDEYFDNNKRSTDTNEYTGIFKDKNLIMIMMESIDNVTVTEESMPTLTRLINEGWYFPNRYTCLSSSGSTISTEYSSLSGLVLNKAYYNKVYNNNYYYSIPNSFKRNGYITSSMHENNGSYYNRRRLHDVLGFDNAYFISDMDVEKESYIDAQMVTNNELYDLIVPKDKGKFMSYMLTIAAHGPYTNLNQFCVDSGAETELECLNYLSTRTDDLLDNLLRRLEEDGLLDDTVIVLYTDHQTYSYSFPDDYLNTLKTVDTSHNIKAVPFVIYSKGMDARTFDDILVNDTDIVPTILNMFGIEYNPNYYIGTDLFSPSHENLVMFTDYSWYDGEVYSFNASVDKTTDTYKTNTKRTKEFLDTNDMILSNNYYNTVVKREKNKE